MKILAFDIGIKNLAWALVDRSTTPYKVVGLANDNIMNMEEGVAAASDAPENSLCHKCKSRASWKSGTVGSCKRHIPETHTIPEGEPRKVPVLTELRRMMTAGEATEFRKAGGKREAAVEILGRRLAWPIEPARAAKTSSLGPEQLHDAIRAFIVRRWEFFAQADHVLLENQPAFKNPHMKTVQILLFSSLREKFYGSRAEGRSGAVAAAPPPFHLVHAKKKVAEAEKGDAGYAERKAKSEERVAGLYRDMWIEGWGELWHGAKKKSDMSDAICMCCDFDAPS